MGGERVRAAVITALDGQVAVGIRDVPEPESRPGQVLVDVDHAGVVFPEVLQTRGEYQLHPCGTWPWAPGWSPRARTAR
jgi:NADPH2:quinone reductase